jgi:hypothetical protein
MRRAYWLGFAVLSLAALQCSSDGTGDTAADAGLADAGATDDAITNPMTMGDGGVTVTMMDTTPPTFGGVTSATSLGETQIALTWMPASDDTTAAASIAYRVYVGTSKGGEDFSAAVVTAPAGATGATLSGLNPYTA